MLVQVTSSVILGALSLLTKASGQETMHSSLFSKDKPLVEVVQPNFKGHCLKSEPSHPFEASQNMRLLQALAHSVANLQSARNRPADPVSLATLYNLQQNSYSKVPEGKLFHGFQRLPIEVPCSKPQLLKHRFPEDSLYAFNGQIVELRPNPEPVSLSSEAAEDLDSVASEEVYPLVNMPSLSDIGYLPVEGIFVSIPQAPSERTVAEHSNTDEFHKVDEDHATIVHDEHERQFERQVEVEKHKKLAQR